MINLKEKLFIIIIASIFLILLTQYKKEVSASSAVTNNLTHTIEVFPSEDTFVTPSTNLGNRRMLMAGHYVDYTIEGNPEFIQSRSLLKFDIPLQPYINIKSAKLSIHHYGSNGEFNLLVKKVLSNWNEQITYPGPATSGIYASTIIPVWNTTDPTQITERQISLDPKLIMELLTNNYGISIEPLEDANSTGIVFCSKDTDQFCLDNNRPKLIIEYTNNIIPNIPKLNIPTDHFGPSNNSAYSQCITSKGCDIILQIESSDPDNNYPVQTEYSITSSSEVIQNELNFETSGSLQTKVHLSDGIWYWQARSTDSLDGLSNTSERYIIVVDTKSPSQTELDTEPQFTKGTQNQLRTSISSDISQIQYLFQVSDRDDFSNIIYSSDWIDKNNFTFSNLNSDIYYYRSKAKDIFDNYTAWSTTKYSIQDNTLPILHNIQVYEDQNSSLNNNIYDNAVISFETDEKFWSFNTVELFYNSKLKNYYRNIPQNPIITIGKEIDYLPSGSYYFKISAHDLAGNKTEYANIKLILDNTNIATLILNESNIVKFYTLRDITPPAAPEVSLFLCDQDICANLAGESGTNIKVNNVYINKSINSSGVASITLTKNWKYNSTYSYNISLTDLAENESAVRSKSITTPQPITGSGGIKYANEEKPYSNITLSSFKKISFKVKLDMKDRMYKLESIFIPPPTLTLVNTVVDKVEIFGLAVPKNYQIIADIEIKYLSLNQAKSECEVGLISLSMFLDSNKKNCIQQKMGIDSLWNWIKEVESECRQDNPILHLICRNAHYNRQKVIYEQKRFTASHVMVSLHNDKNNDYIGHIWNDNPVGTFYFNTYLNNNIQVGDSLKAKVNLFGEFETNGITVNYSGINYEDSLHVKGLQSSFSNKLKIDNSEWVYLNGVEAKTLDVPYFNQYLEPDGKYVPADGWQMCGAASSVMVAGYFHKLNYDFYNPYSLKKFMYQDAGQGITTHSCGPDKGGAFELTNYYCTSNWNGGITKYLDNRGLHWNYLTGNNSKNTLSIDAIKTAINDKHPIILGMRDHIIVIKGFTKTNEVVVNDPYKDYFKPGGYSMNGNNAIYTMNQLNSARIYYAIEVSQ